MSWPGFTLMILMRAWKGSSRFDNSTVSAVAEPLEWVWINEADARL